MPIQSSHTVPGLAGAESAAATIAAVAPLVLLYKHSPSCGVSATARRDVERFADAHPDVPVVEVDVIRDRGLSRQLAEELRVRHESPQAILLRDGAVAWHGSHWDVRRDVLAGAVASARTGTSPDA
jgi:thioredoxin 1